MQRQSFILYLLLLLGTNFAVTGCSTVHNQGGVNSLAPVISGPITLETGSGCDRTFLGAWYAVIDPKSGSFTIEPVDRVTSFHYLLTNRYPNVLTVEYYNFGPPFVADLKLKHPLPNSGIDVFDPRVIAILPANAGVSADYPELDFHANHSVIRQPDGYTRLWDRQSIPGNANPFKAYFKDSPYRMWSSTVNIEDTVRWVLDLDGFGGPVQFVLVVDISTKYPDPPQGIIDNAPEPVELTAEITSNLEANGSGEALVEVTATDWQGASGIGEVAIESPAVFTGKKLLAFSGPDTEQYKYKYSGNFTNELNAPGGRYGLLVSASDSSTGVTMYQEFEYQIHGDINFSFQDLTPPDISVIPTNFIINGDFAYVASSYGPYSSGGRLNIFDLTDPVNPVYAGYYEPMGTNYQVQNGYVYYTSGTQGLKVVRMTSPSSPEIVQIVTPSGSESYGLIFVDGQYAYISTDLPSVAIIDISLPENAYIISEIPLSAIPGSFRSGNGYLYVTFDGQMEIYDVDPPQDFHMVYTGSMDMSCDIIRGNYAYFSDNRNIEIYDVSSPENFHRVGEMNLSYDIRNFAFRDNYIYVVASSNIVLYDIADPQHIQSVDNYPIKASMIAINGNRLYALNSDLFMYQISPPDEPEFINKIPFSSGVDKLSINDGYAYMTRRTGIFKIVDIDPISSAEVVRQVNINSEIYDICVHDSYAYIGSNSTAQLFIIDARYPANANLVNSLDLPNGERVESMHVFNGLLYISTVKYENPGYSSWIYTYDISRPYAPRLLQTYEYDGWLRDLCISDDNLFITIKADQVNYLKIFNISNPEAPQFISETEGTSLNLITLFVRNGYAYVIWYAAEGYSGGLLIYDIDPLQTPQLIKYVYFSLYLQDIAVTDDYVYGITADGFLKIVDIFPAEQASIIEEHRIYSGTIPRTIIVEDNIAYTGNEKLGLRITSLW